jgi:hypothetical protein
LEGLTASPTAIPMIPCPEEEPEPEAEAEGKRNGVEEVAMNTFRVEISNGLTRMEGLPDACERERRMTRVCEVEMRYVSR